MASSGRLPRIDGNTIRGQTTSACEGIYHAAPAGSVLSVGICKGESLKSVPAIALILLYELYEIKDAENLYLD